MPSVTAWEGRPGGILAWLGAMAMPVLVATGCTYVEENLVGGHDDVAQVDAVDLQVDVGPEGVASYRALVAFRSDEGGDYALPVPADDVRDVRVDGRPVDLTAEAGMPVVPVAGPSATVTWTAERVASTWADAVTLELPLWEPPPERSRQDEPVALRARLTLPAVPTDLRWHGARSEDVGIAATTAELEGRVEAWDGSVVAAALPPGTVAGEAGPEGALAVTSTALRLPEWTDLQDDLDAAEAERNAELEAEEQGWLWVAGILVVFALVAVGAGTWSSSRSRRVAARERRQARSGVPATLPEPPGPEDPALVAVLVGEGRRIDPVAVAGTVLDLAHRGTLRLEGLDSRRFFLRRRAAGPAPRFAGEEAVLAGLGRQSRDGVNAGPPLWPSRRGLVRTWAAYRRDAARRAEQAGWVKRVHVEAVLVPALALLAFLTYPIWLGTRLGPFGMPVVLLGLLVLGALASVWTYLRGPRYRLTPAGWRRGAEWEAFGRHAEEAWSMTAAGAPGVATWGDWLSRAVVLGVAPVAAAPQDGPSGDRHDPDPVG